MASVISDDAIRAAVCALLDSDSEAAALLHDRMAFRDVGAFTTFPFLAIGHTKVHALSPTRVEKHVVTVHLWLEPDEAETAQRLMQIIRRALESGPLQVCGADVRSFRHEASSVRLASELEALHGTVRFRLTLSRGPGTGRRADEPAPNTRKAVPSPTG